jgi:broad specificity phosphatase PhoE
MRRARETAAPLEAAWRCTARIVEAVTELPTPRLALDERPAWLEKVMRSGWDHADATVLAWRRSLLDFLTRCETNMVVFSHYVAINTAVGAALGLSDFAPYKPANASITIFDNEGGRLRLIEQGASGHHRPPVR